MCCEAVRVVGDGEQLRQVVWNLMSNSVKFTPSGGRIQVDVFARDHQAHITVTDTGMGIAPAFLPHVFERFRQAEAGYETSGGLGLGLNISRHLVQAHGGDITVSSEGEGHCTTFHVVLPMRVDDEPRSTLPPETDSPT